MFRTFLLWMVLTGCALAGEPLRVYNWAQYIDPATVRSFEQQSGARVDYRTFTTAAERDAALFDTPGVDVVVPSHFQLQRLIREGRLRPLERGQLPHYANLDPKLLAALASFGNAQRYAVPYQWSSAGLAQDDDVAAEHFGGPLPESWSLVFDERQLARLAPCGVSWLDAPEETYSLLLNYRGKRLQRTSVGSLERLGQSLVRLSPYLRAVNNEAYVQDLAGGRLCLAVAWSGQALMAARQRPSLRFVVPEEGAPISLETWVIPSTASNPELAHRFIDHMLLAENAARNSAWTFFYSALREDLPEMRELLRRQPELALAPRLRRRLYFLEQPSAEQKSVMDRDWAASRVVGRPSP